mmetsp:Transcript_42821/g.105554  ORF Transcript_42821/g.105554 Transcript_42821/m.105554 type:complete len:254 (-) Transcript_42821:108-869(-)
MPITFTFTFTLTSSVLSDPALRVPSEPGLRVPVPVAGAVALVARVGCAPRRTRRARTDLADSSVCARGTGTRLLLLRPEVDASERLVERIGRGNRRGNRRHGHRPLIVIAHLRGTNRNTHTANPIADPLWSTTVVPTAHPRRGSRVPSVHVISEFRLLELVCGLQVAAQHLVRARAFRDVGRKRRVRCAIGLGRLRVPNELRRASSVRHPCPRLRARGGGDGGGGFGCGGSGLCSCCCGLSSAVWDAASTPLE